MCIRDRFFSVFYILVLWIFAQFAGPNKGNAEVATLNGKVVGAANVGQQFTEDIYFWGRPSLSLIHILMLSLAAMALITLASCRSDISCLLYTSRCV